LRSAPHYDYPALQGIPPKPPLKEQAMNKYLTGIAALAALFSAPAHAADSHAAHNHAAHSHAAHSYTIDPTHTWPVFEVNHLGFSTQRGRFNKSSGKIVIDATAKKGSVELVIETASIDMGFDKWDEHMKSDEFFNVAQFPTMRFASDKLVFKGDKVVAAEGNFTLLGVTRPLTLTVSNFHCAMHPMVKKPACGADINATLKRTEFGMTKFIPAVSDEVRISSPVEATRD
jgi:polyisoprenoid-binding protein YceI